MSELDFSCQILKKKKIGRKSPVFQMFHDFNMHLILFFFTGNVMPHKVDLLAAAREESLEISQQQENFIGTTLVDIAREVASRVHTLKEEDFYFDREWKRIGPNKGSKKANGNVPMKHRYRFLVSTDAEQAIQKNLQKNHNIMKKKYKKYNESPYKSIANVEAALEKYQSIHTGSYQISNIVCLMPGRATDVATRTPIQVANPFQEDKPTKTKNGNNDEDVEDVVPGFDSTHFLLLRFFEYPYMSNDFRNKYLENITPLIDKGVIILDNVLVLTAFAMSLTTKFSQAATSYRRNVMRNSKDFVACTRGKNDIFKRHLAWHIINDMLDAFQEYTSLKDDKYVLLWRNICGNFFEKDLNTRGDIKFEKDDKLSDFVGSLSIHLDKVEADNIKKLFENSHHMPCFFRFLSIYYVYFILIMKEPKVVEQTNLNWFLKGQYYHGDKDEKSFIPDHLRLRWDLPHNFIDSTNDAWYKLRVKSDTDLPDRNTTNYIVVSKKIPCSAKGLIQFLTSAPLNSKQSPVKFHIFDMVAFQFARAFHESRDPKDKVEMKEGVNDYFHGFVNNPHSSSGQEPARTTARTTNANLSRSSTSQQVMLSDLSAASRRNQSQPNPISGRPPLVDGQNTSDPTSKEVTDLKLIMMRRILHNERPVSSYAQGCPKSTSSSEKQAALESFLEKDYNAENYLSRYLDLCGADVWTEEELHSYGDLIGGENKENGRVLVQKRSKRCMALHKVLKQNEWKHDIAKSLCIEMDEPFPAQKIGIDNQTDKTRGDNATDDLDMNEIRENDGTKVSAQVGDDDTQSIAIDDNDDSSQSEYVDEGSTGNKSDVDEDEGELNVETPSNVHHRTFPTLSKEQIASITKPANLSHRGDDEEIDGDPNSVQEGDLTETSGNKPEEVPIITPEVEHEKTGKKKRNNDPPSPTRASKRLRNRKTPGS